MAYKGPQVVVGPSSATDETIPRFDATTGALIQGSGVTLDDSNVIGGITQINVDNLRLDGNTISSTDTNGDIVLAPDGSGTISVTAAPIVPSTDRADSLGSATNSWDNIYADGLTFNDGTDTAQKYLARDAWTPTLTFGGGSTGITYGSQVGYYGRIGKLAIIYINMQLTSKGSDTGNALIEGFPVGYFSNRQSTALAQTANLTFDSASYTSFQITGYASPNFYLEQSGPGVTQLPLTDANFANNSIIRITFSWLLLNE